MSGVLILILGVVGFALQTYWKQRDTTKQAQGGAMPGFGGSSGERRPAERKRSGRTGKSGSGLSQTKRTDRPSPESQTEPAASSRNASSLYPSSNGSSNGSSGGAYDAPSAKQEEPILEQSDYMRAVVWSEILGPPRAKRPYRRS